MDTYEELDYVQHGKTALKRMFIRGLRRLLVHHFKSSITFRLIIRSVTEDCFHCPPKLNACCKALST